MCDDLVTFVLLYHASQLCAASINMICQSDFSKSNILVRNRNECDSNRNVCDRQG